jgi:hypothetical protein
MDNNKTKKRLLAAREVLNLPGLRGDLRQGLNSENWEAALAEYARLYVKVDYRLLSKATLNTLEGLQKEEMQQPEAESEEAEFYQEVRAEDPPPPPPPEPPQSPPSPPQPTTATTKKKKIWEVAAQALEEAGAAGLSLEEATALLEAAFPERKANRKKQTRDLFSFWLPKRRIKTAKISGRYYLAKFAPNDNK